VSAPILIVEDNPDDLLFLQRAFRGTSIAAPLRVVTDGAAALDYLAGRGAYADRGDHPLPALMLLDLKLPRVSGFEVLRWLRAEPGLRRLPVVVLTSSTQDDDISQAYDLGANSYVVKPSGLKQIAEVAKQIEAYWLTLNQRPTVAR
jgi:CheY-like chemotaxis protein